MAKDARTGAGKTRAPADLSGQSSKGNGQGAAGSAKTTPAAPEPAPNLNLSRFWKKGGSPFDATRAALQSSKGTSSPEAFAATAPVQPLSWATANRPITVGVVISCIWLVVFAFYITRTLGWSELFLLLPPEFGGLVAVGLMPIAFLWLLIAAGS